MRATRDMSDAARLSRRFALAGALALGVSSLFPLMGGLRQQGEDAAHERRMRAGVLARMLAAQIGVAVGAGVPLERFVDLPDFAAQRRRGDALLSIAVCDARRRELAASGVWPPVAGGGACARTGDTRLDPRRGAMHTAGTDTVADTAADTDTDTVAAAGAGAAPIVATDAAVCVEAPVRDTRTGDTVGFLRVRLAAGDAVQRVLAPLALRLGELLVVVAAVLGLAGEAVRVAWRRGPALRERIVLAGARGLRAEDFALSWRGAARRHWDARAQDHAHLARQVNESERRAWRLVDSLSRTEADPGRRAQLSARLAHARGPARFAGKEAAMRCGVATPAQARWLAVLAGCAVGALGALDVAGTVPGAAASGASSWWSLATLLGVAAACRPPIGARTPAAAIGVAACLGLVLLAWGAGALDPAGTANPTSVPAGGLAGGWTLATLAHAAAGVCLGALLGAADSAVRLASRRSCFDMARDEVRGHWLGAALGLFWFGPVAGALAVPVVHPVVAWMVEAVLPGCVTSARVAQALVPATFAAAAAGLLWRCRGDPGGVAGRHPWQGCAAASAAARRRARPPRGAERRAVVAAALALAGWCLQADAWTSAWTGAWASAWAGGKPGAADAWTTTLAAAGEQMAGRGLPASLLLWMAVGLGLLAGARQGGRPGRGALRPRVAVLHLAAALVLAAQVGVLMVLARTAPAAAPMPAAHLVLIALGWQAWSALGAGLLAVATGRRLAALRAPFAECLPVFCVVLGMFVLAAPCAMALSRAARLPLPHAGVPLLACAAALAVSSWASSARRRPEASWRADHAD